MKILVDAYGSDKGPEEIKQGCKQALIKHPGLFIGLIGPETLGEDLPERMEILPTSEWISNEEEPAKAVRAKKQASIVLGARKMEEDYEGLLSAGSTGAMLATGLLITKRLPGISRAALTILLPTRPHPTVLLDAGANMDTDARLLTQFGLMGSIYARNVLGLKQPRVGLLNVGTEEGKGNALTKESFSLLENAPLHFIGNVEARDLFSSVCDVVVCDGFTGNIALKTLEGTAGFITSALKEELMAGTKTKIGAFLAKDALRNLKNRLDYTQTGAAPLLGIRKPLFKAHGSSNAEAIANGIDKLVLFIEKDTIGALTVALQENPERGA